MPAAASHASHAAVPPQESEHVCSLCCKKAECRPVESLRQDVLEELERRGFDPSGDNATICTACLSSAMTHQARSQLTGDKRELAEVEEEIAARASEIVDEIEHGAPQSFGHRAADAVARVGGSWGFVLGFIAMLIAWAVVNSVVLAGGFDPYPYILLNLVLSCLASIQAPIILMSQSRMAEIDRIRATEDFRINLKAQLEIASLHEKIDHMVREQEALLRELNPRRAKELDREKQETHARRLAPGRGSTAATARGAATPEDGPMLQRDDRSSPREAHRRPGRDRAATTSFPRGSTR